MLRTSSVNMLLFFLALPGYFFPARFSYAMAVVSLVLVLPAIVFVNKIDTLNAIFSILVFNGIQLSILEYKNVIRRHREAWDLKLKQEEGAKKNILTEFEKLNIFEQGLKQRELDIVNLYEITKRMSASLKFDDIFKIFSMFLRENFTFRESYLLMLKREGPETLLEKIYCVRHSGPELKTKCKINTGKLIKTFSNDIKAVYLSKNDDREYFEELGINNEEMETFIGVPLMSEKKMVGIVAVENMPKEDFEKFVILSSQFALEIKKVMLYEMVETLAITDSLTGLYVRRYFSERMDEELRRCKRHKFRFAFLMVDIDDFKHCNDTYGHMVGDVVLKDIARILKESVREIDIVARYGGEEFAIILSETALDGAMIVAERVRKKVEENVFRAYDEHLKMTVSIGISVFPKDAGDIKGIIDRADMALYAAKKSGKNLVREYKRRYNKSL